MDTHFPFIFLKKEERFNIFVLSFFLFLGDAYLQPETHSAVFSSFFQLQTETHSLFPFFSSLISTRNTFRCVLSSVTRIGQKHIPLCFFESLKTSSSVKKFETHSAVFSSFFHSQMETHSLFPFFFFFFFTSTRNTFRYVLSSVTKLYENTFRCVFSSVPKHRLQRTNFSSLLGKFLLLKFNRKQTLPLIFFSFSSQKWLC